MKVVDLSRTLGGHDHFGWPSGPPVDYRLIHTHEEHGRTNATIFFNIHEGTHIDPPYHFHADGQTIDEIPLATLIAPGCLARLPRVKPDKPISLAQVLSVWNPPEDLTGYVIIIDSGWGSFSTSEGYYKHSPYLAQDLADWLVARKVRAVGLTNPPDKVEPPRKGDAPIHRTLLGNGVLIIENITNLEAITTPCFTVIALPLKILRGCGGPARVVAILDEGVFRQRGA